MENSIIYTDTCCSSLIESIKEELNLDVVQRFKSEEWSVNNAMSLVTAPNLVLAVINTIDEISVMEIALLNFMCKPILVTAASIESYPTVEKTVDFIDKNANLRDMNSNFISWYKTVVEDQWIKEDYRPMQTEQFSG